MGTMDNMDRTLSGTHGKPCDEGGGRLDRWTRDTKARGEHDSRCQQKWAHGMDYTHIAAQAYSRKLSSPSRLKRIRMLMPLDEDARVTVNPKWFLPRDVREGDASPRRLLCRGGLLQDADKLGPTPYATVSYVWTDFPDVNWNEIREEMERRTGICNLWADRICIDQKDPKDKANEVSKMASYYLGASACLILTKQRGLMEAVEEWTAAGCRLGTKEYKAALEQCVNLIKSAYFKRIWTMQELELSAFCFILSPSGWVAGNDIDALLTTAVENICRAVPAAAHHWPEECQQNVWNAGDPDKGFERMVAVFDKRWTRWGATDAEWLRSIRRPLMVVWHRAKGRRCSEQKDYLWGISALVEQWEEFGTSYEEAFAVSMRKVLSKDRTATAILRWHETLSVPCWMPAFTDGVPDLGAGWALDEHHAEPASFSEDRIVMNAVQVWPCKRSSSQEVLTIAKPRGEGRDDWFVGIRPYPLRRQDWKRLWVVCQRQQGDPDPECLMLFDENEHGEIVHKIDSVPVSLSPPWAKMGIAKASANTTRIHIGHQL